MAMINDVDYPGMEPTIHMQVGRNVYFATLDVIVPNDQNLANWIRDNMPHNDEVTGTAQGEGVDTVWFDGTNQPLEWSYNAEELKARAAYVRRLDPNLLPRLKQTSKDGVDIKEVKFKIKARQRKPSK